LFVVLRNGGSAPPASIAGSPAAGNATAEAYCDSIKENIVRINQRARNFESTLPTENPNSPRNPNYKASKGWQVLSCDATSDPDRVGGMVDVGGGHAWQFKALKSAYPFSGDDIRVVPTPGAHTQPARSPNASASAAIPHPSHPFVVSIETSFSGGARPTVTGTTNLPDGMQLTMRLQKPWLPNVKERLAAGLTACGDDDCSPLMTHSNLPNGVGFGVIVKNGHFSDGPFTDKGAALRPGLYVLEVIGFWAATQPPDVRAKIGELGENMTGPLVGGCCFGGHLDQAEIQKVLDKQRSSASILGASIYYAGYVTIDAD
jgi:hypothetical protein